MANDFVAIPANVLEDYLQSLRFERGTYGQEVVYTKRSTRNPSVVIKVYTSIRVGQSVVRAAGRDAIRVCVVYDNGARSFGIGRFPPVMRVVSVESVLARLFEKLKAAAKRASQWMDQDEARNQSEYAQRVADKTAYAAYEAAKENAAHANQPDAWDADPCSEPPDSEVSYEQYVAHIS